MMIVFGDTTDSFITSESITYPGKNCCRCHLVSLKYGFYAIKKKKILIWKK